MEGLTLVPTPIGNLEDITLRALRVLKEVDVVLAEDTRTSGNLLKHYDIQNSMFPFHQHNEHKVLSQLVSRMKAGEAMALVSDAGTPGISDPGFLLVRECIKEGIKVDCLPGATAFVPALVMSGFPSDKFIFEGFLPHKKGRQTRLSELALEERTIVLYESPHRIVKTLLQLAEVMGPERTAAVGRELTKMHEEVRRGTLKELSDHYSIKESVKGEIVLIVAGKN